MNLDKSLLFSLSVLLSAAVVLMVFSWDMRLLLLLLLFLPLLDKKWLNQLSQNKNFFKQKKLNTYTLTSLVFLFVTAIVSITTNHFELFFRSLLFAAIPEEWYFRAYLMTKLGKGFRSNVMTSFVFSLLHGITRGWLVGLWVFVPSLIYGWFYQRTNNILLVITMHAISNMVYLVWLKHVF